MTDPITKLSREDLDAIPDKYLATIIEILMGPENATIKDLSSARIRTSVENIYPLFIVMYGLLILAGTVMNCGMIWHITRDKLYKDPTYAYLINIAVSNVIKCVVVLPMSLAVMLIHNWIYGKFMCYFLPMLQDIPIHVSMMTFVLIAADRYRVVSDPGKPRIPAFSCAIGAWFFAVCIVLPHPIYTTYLDLEIYRKEHFRGIGICITNLMDDIQQYVRGLFLLTYVAPLTIIAYVYVKSSRELQTQEGPIALAIYEARTNDSCPRHGSSISTGVTSIRDGKRDAANVEGCGTGRVSATSQTCNLYEAELDVCREKRTQKYLISMVSVFAVLFCPLMVLKLAKLAVVETYENMAAFDITFILIVWLAFLSTITTPSFYASWQMSRSTKERLRGYFRFRKSSLIEYPVSAPEIVDNPVSRGRLADPNVARTQNTHHGNLPRNNAITGISRGIPQAYCTDLYCTEI